MTAEQAIARSISHTEIVTIPWSAESERRLTAMADDSTGANDGVTEYWGGDGDHAWRVHTEPA